MKLLSLITAIFLSISMLGMVHALQFSEVMFNPDGSDTGREWIELTVNETEECINLTQYKLYEEGTNHNIYPYANDIICGYAVICSDYDKFMQEYPYINSSIENFSIFKSSFSLNNNGEVIAIKYNGTTMDELNYTITLLAKNISEGYSIEKVNDSWTQSKAIGGTPGYIIVYNYTEEATNDTENVSENTTLNYTDTNNTDENASNSSYYNLSSENSGNCAVMLNIVIKNESEIYDDGTTIKFYNKITSENCSDSVKSGLNYSIEYWVEDLFGNIVKNPVSTNNQNEKSFTPKITEEDRILLIKSVIQNISCDTTNVIKNADEKNILIKNNHYTAQQTTCPTNKCVSQKSESCSYSKSAIQNCSDTVKIINNCENATILTGTFGTKSYNTPTQSTAQASNVVPTDNSSNTSVTGEQMTGNIIYESPNQKNRAYALIGLSTLGLIGVTFITYRLYARKNHKARQ